MLLGLIGCAVDTASGDGTFRPQCKNTIFDRLVANFLSESVPLLDVEELRHHESSYLILDARELEEYEVSHLEGAQWLGNKVPNWDILEGVDTLQPILLYCSIGYRSEKMGEILLQKGFKNVYNLYGSIFEWSNRGYPIFDSYNNTTQKLHGYSRNWGMWIDAKNTQVVYD